MRLVLSILLLLFFVGLALFFCQKTFVDDARQGRRWLLGWAAKGAGFPILIWFFMNVGVSSILPPFLSSLRYAQSTGGSLKPQLPQTMAVGIFVIGTYWAAFTLGWLIILMSSRRKETRVSFGPGLLGSMAALLVSWLLFGQWGVWGWGLIATFSLFPLAYLMLEEVVVETPPPSYARARSRMNLGHYNEAEWEVIQELEQHQDDFDGWMMLAELYASRFRDLQSADHTVRDLCQQPNINPVQYSIAMHRLADWHLKWGQDPVAARRALEGICQKVPGSHLDKMARLRIDRLPRTREELQAQAMPKKLRLPVTGDQLGPPATDDQTAIRKKEATARAQQCVEKLKQNPNDVAAREEFARLLVEPLAQVDVALDQMELLLAMHGQPPEKKAEWLSAMADWQMRYRGDSERAQELWERLIDEFPDSPQAFTARQRLNLRRLEQKMRTAGSTRVAAEGKLRLPSPE